MFMENKDQSVIFKAGRARCGGSHLSTLWRLRQQDQEFEVSLGYTAHSKPVGAT